MPAVAGIRSILLHADATAQSATRLEIARELADGLEAELTALFGATPDTDRLASAYSAGAALDDLASGASAMAHDQARARLRDSAGGAPPTVWCDIAGDSISHGFVREAAYADLLVVGQQSGPPLAGAAPPGFTETVILESGRPTLVVPREPRSDRLGERVLIAWNGSPQAARALAGALPLLQRALEVHVASWAPQPMAAPFSRLTIGAFLRRHGLDPIMHLRTPTSQVGLELTALAHDLKADLVVMGCYGRSRASERVLGGASRSLLETMPVPLLMAH
ncbi:MAG: universal stress protein [Caldimonas sp.]